LGDGQVLHLAPGGAAVAGEEQAAVAAQHQVLRVGRVDPQGVVVGVDPGGAVGGKRPAAVGRDVHADAEDVDPAVVGRVHADLAVVERAGAEVVDLGPGLAAVVGAEDAAGLGVAAGPGRLAPLAVADQDGPVGLDDGVPDARVLAADGQA